MIFSRARRRGEDLAPHRRASRGWDGCHRGGLYLWGGRAPRAPPVELTTQLTLELGPELEPALSPDGKMIAYAAGAFGQMDIHVRQVAGGRPLRLAENVPGNRRWPRWSPDGSRIAFTAWVGELQSEVYVVPALGGLARRLTEARADEVVFGIAC